MKRILLDIWSVDSSTPLWWKTSLKHFAEHTAILMNVSKLFWFSPHPPLATVNTPSLTKIRPRCYFSVWIQCFSHRHHFDTGRSTFSSFPLIQRSKKAVNTEGSRYREGGETLVLLNWEDYDRKIKEFLTQSGASPCNLSTNSHSEKTRKLIQDANHIITGSRISSERRFYIMNYSFPKIYGQIKTHKPGHPISVSILILHTILVDF